MQKTVIIYESETGNTKLIVQKMAMVLGPAIYCTTENFKKEYKDGDFFVIVTPIHNDKINEKISKFVLSNATWLIDKRVGILCTEVRDTEGLKHLKQLQNILQNSVVHVKCIENSEDNISITNFALELKRVRENFIKRMPKTELNEYINEFLKSHNTCDLATGYNNWIRSTPMEYIYDEKGNIYMLTEGGKKFANLLLNSRVSISVYDEYKQDLGKLRGMQIRGKAHLLDFDSKEYEEVLRLKDLTKEKIQKLGFLMNIIKIKIEKIEFLDNDFRKLGYDEKQIKYYEKIK